MMWNMYDIQKNDDNYFHLQKEKIIFLMFIIKKKIRTKKKYIK